MGMAQTSTPKTIQALIDAATALGGEVVETAPRRFEFALPCRVVGGKVELVNRVAVGYYVKGGKNIIGNAQIAREEIAYWGKQSGRA
jgi:hypothetical protein